MRAHTGYARKGERQHYERHAVHRQRALQRLLNVDHGRREHGAMLPGRGAAN